MVLDNIELIEEILEEAPAIIVLYKEKIVYVNKYALKLTGYKKEEVIGKPLWEFASEKEKIKEMVLKRIQGAVAKEITDICSFIKKDGSLIYLKYVAKTLKIDNEFYGLLLAIDVTKQVELEKKLKEKVETIKSLNVPVIKVKVSLKDLKIVEFNPLNKEFYNLTGYKEKDITPDWFLKNIHPEELKKIKPEELKEKEIFSWEFRFRRKDGKYIWVKEFLKVLSKNSIIEFVATWIDITKEKDLQAKLRKSKNEMSIIFRYSPDIVVKLKKDGTILFKSYATRKLGYEPWQVLGKNIFDYIHPEDKEIFKNTLNFSFENRNKTYKVEYRVLKSNGDWAWLEGNVVVPKNIKEAFLIERDITDRKKAEEKIFKLMYYDPLTEIPNKFLFLENLKQLIQGISGYVPVLVLKILNLDDLKLVYPEDLIINKIKNILQKKFNKFLIGKTLTHEFLIAGVVKNLKHFDLMLNDLQKIFSNGLKLDGNIVYPTLNTGISLYPKTSEDPEELLNQAFIALYESNKKGENCIVWYSEEVQKRFERNEKIIKLLPKSIKSNELKVFYQPIVRLRDKKIIGFEALIRWFSNELGYVPPNEFIPIAEETEFIKTMTDFVINNSINDILKLDRNYFVSVNFSSKEFEDESFIKDILRNIEKNKLQPENFVVEITERTAMKNPDYTTEVLKKLKENGIQIAIDDFGTGYSNMNYIVEFDIDRIKIDKDFVINIIKSKKHLDVVKLIVEISHKLNALSIAEGVETDQVLNKLIELNCDEGQGYLFSPPVPFEEIKNLIGEFNER